MPGPAVRDDPVERQFRSSATDTVQITDIAEHLLAATEECAEHADTGTTGNNPD